jgi:hypothetical protein
LRRATGDAFQLELNPGSVSAPTSLIVTGAATQARAADVVTLTSPPSFGASYTIFGAVIPNAPAALNEQQRIVSIDDGTVNNRVELHRTQATGNATIILQSGGVQAYNAQISVVLTNVVGKAAFAATAGTQNAAVNGVNTLA